MTYTCCPFCGAYSRKSCELEDDMGPGSCLWDEPDPDLLREDRDEIKRLEREYRE
jgi:hypothetical protein